MRAIIAYALRCAGRVHNLIDDRDNLRAMARDGLRHASGYTTGQPVDLNLIEKTDDELTVVLTGAHNLSPSGMFALECTLANVRAVRMAVRSEKSLTYRDEFAGRVVRAAVKAIDSAMSADHSIVVALLSDWCRLAELDLGAYPTPGRPIDPSGKGPLGPFDSIAISARTRQSPRPAPALSRPAGAPSQVEDLRKELEEERRELETQREFFESNRRQFETRRSEFDAERGQFESERDELLGKVERLKTQLAEAEDNPRVKEVPVEVRVPVETEETKELRQQCESLQEDCRRLQDELEAALAAAAEPDELEEEDFPLPKAEELEQLPLRAIVALAFRAAVRVQPMFQIPEEYPGAEDAMEVVQSALRQAYSFARGLRVESDKVAAIEAATGAAIMTANKAMPEMPAIAMVANAAYAAVNATNYAFQSLNDPDPLPGARRVIEAALSTLESARSADPEIRPCLAADWIRVAQLGLTGFPEFGDAIDPTDAGPFGPLVPERLPEPGEQPALADSATAEERERLETLAAELEEREEDLVFEKHELELAKAVFEEERRKFEAGVESGSPGSDTAALQEEVAALKQTLQQERDELAQQRAEIEKGAQLLKKQKDKCAKTKQTLAADRERLEQELADFDTARQALESQSAELEQQAAQVSAVSSGLKRFFKKHPELRDEFETITGESNLD